MCTHTADSQQKLTQNCKVIILLLKNKYTVSVCHKPGKGLSPGVVLIAVNILKTKISTHRGKRRLTHSFSRSGKSSQQK